MEITPSQTNIESKMDQERNVEYSKQEITGKTIRTNKIKIRSLSQTQFITPKQAIEKFFKTDTSNIQYIGSEYKQDDQLISCRMHPFVEAVHIAYSKHLPLNISPDI